MPVVQRRAPTAGYNFPAKVEYRNAVWRTFAKSLKVAPRNAHAMLMPSVEGAEIGVAIRHGFREENLHIVDANAAIVAVLKRRYPKINTYGVTVGRAFERMARAGVSLSCANLDFTTNLGSQLASELRAVGASGVLRQDASLGLTMLRGRERAAWSYIAQNGGTSGAAIRRQIRRSTVGERALTDADYWRLMYSWAHLSGYASAPRACGIYLSVSGQTMLWAVSRSIHIASMQFERHNDAFLAFMDGLVSPHRLSDQANAESIPAGAALIVIAMMEEGRRWLDEVNADLKRKTAFLDRALGIA